MFICCVPVVLALTTASSAVLQLQQCQRRTISRLLCEKVHASCLRHVQAIPPYITASGANLAKMQLIMANDKRKEWEAQGGTSDPCAQQMVMQVTL